MKEEKFENVSIQFTREDKNKLIKKAKANRLKLSSYLRHELTKNLRDE